MKQHKKIIIGLVLGLAIITASIGGVVMAAEEESDIEADSRAELFLDKVAANYLEITGQELNVEALKEAYRDARQDVLADAMQNRLDKLVEEGVITPDEADEWSSWWSEKPDTAIGLGFAGARAFPGKARFFTPFK